MRAGAVDAARSALRAAGFGVTGHGDGPMVRVVVDDRTLRMRVEAAAYATGQVARELAARSPSVSTDEDLPLLVADRITADARAVLGAAGWSWLDRRGRLHVHAPGVRVDVDVPAERAVRGAGGGPAVRGRAGLTVAYWLCAHPGASLSPTRHRAELRLAPSTISTAVHQLADAGLVDAAGAAVVPELFWELAGVWRSDRVWVARRPDPADVRSADPEASSWRLSGTAAAVAHGAPVVTTDEVPLELYVPGPVDLSIATRRYGTAAPGTGAAMLAVAPVAQVCERPIDQAGVDLMIEKVQGWDLAPKLAVALDLAQDQARGREILDDWKDPAGVWR